MFTLENVAIVGGGVIGAGWVARFIENGIDVAIYDPAPDAEAKIQAVLSNSRAAYKKLIKVQRKEEGRVRFCKDIADAVSNVQLIVESVPERLDLKQAVYAELELHADSETLIASSTSGIMPSELQAKMSCPERLLVAHPFNPVYLLPLVELVGGSATSSAVIEKAKIFYQSIGMKPLHVKKEIEAFIADRLLEAIWRESLWLVKDGIATTEDIDDAVRFGFGLRYAQMGVFDTYRVAGGEAGMRHFMEQFGPCLQWPWSKLTDVPEFTEDLVDLITTQSDAQSGHMTIREMERIRDDNLVAIIQALKANDWGAGKTLANYEAILLQAANDPD
jgi:carnitine 3-dehydrogenase